jgi:hypothetical protein
MGAPVYYGPFHEAVHSRAYCLEKPSLLRSLLPVYARGGPNIALDERLVPCL